jgi:hypothetical protein
MELSYVDKIWNRAAMEAGGVAPLEGDVALAALLVVHGMVMNGGVDHALDVLDSTEIMAGVVGFRYYGFHEVADLLEDVAPGANSDFQEVNEAYWELVPMDSTLSDAFEEKFLRSPEVFAPLSD